MTVGRQDLGPAAQGMSSAGGGEGFAAGAVVGSRLGQPVGRLGAGAPGFRASSGSGTR